MYAVGYSVFSLILKDRYVAYLWGGGEGVDGIGGGGVGRGCVCGWGGGGGVVVAERL